MAKKKSAARPKSTNVTPNAVVVRGTAEWREWVVGLSKLCGLGQADTVVQGLMMLATVKGYRPMPERMEKGEPKP